MVSPHNSPELGLSEGRPSPGVWGKVPENPEGILNWMGRAVARK